MPPHDDPANRNNQMHHPRHVGHPPHAGREIERAGGLYRQLKELKDMAASHEDLHTLIDGEKERFVSRLSDRTNLAISDPGRGTPDNTVDPMERARMLFFQARDTEADWMIHLTGKAVLVIAEFPPHILDRMLRSAINVTQIHPPTPDGDTPPHFHHLAQRGLRGVLDFKGLTEVVVQVALFEGVRDSQRICVSPLVPVALRMFPDVEVAVIDAEHRAPHMTVSIIDKGFVRIPRFD